MTTDPPLTPPVSAPAPPSAGLVEAAKIVHLASLVAIGLLLLALFGVPAVFGHEALATMVIVVLVAAGALALVQATSLVFLAMRRRRLATAPRLVRPEAKTLQFDRNAAPPEARQE